ncbi:MAG: hypothetical protein CL398_00820 [Acidiferrobacteraceae bacterium]|nr:hypothetical protein [Acidiferrobacteraceae bacterium]|tara:strand:- start:418 stop:1026 length:609 start_codon:yes stop_codon:yes gene_type:complete
MLFDQISAFLQVVIVDLVLAGDNAIIIGMVAATVPADQRRRVIMIGILLAAVMRIAFALITVQLLEITGILLIGGLLLLWVCWKLIQQLTRKEDEVGAPSSGHGSPSSVKRAIWQIIVADLSMSLDNVLAVAGVARHHPVILIFGLILSIVLMAAGAALVARMLERYRWIAYIGLAILLYVALSMIWSGAIEINAELLTKKP